MTLRGVHPWLRRASLTAVLAASALIESDRAHAAPCPSYTRSSAGNTRGCAVDAVSGVAPAKSELDKLLTRIAKGPSAWGSNPPTVSKIRSGCTAPTTLTPRFPCEILKAIAWQESLWCQFCAPTSPSDQKGKTSQTIISFDCGYGIMQVTSGMREGEQPSFDRQRVASDPAYNVAVGASILAQKWQATPCVGARDPGVIEHWYYALWAYNGFSFINSPNHPNYAPDRGSYDPKVDHPADYPYQERVLGLVEHPPNKLWQAVAVSYPDLADIARKPTALPEPRCASPTDCTQQRNVHRSLCTDDVVAETTPPPPPRTGAAGSAPVPVATGPESHDPPKAEPEVVNEVAHEVANAEPAQPTELAHAERSPTLIWGCAGGLSGAGVLLIAGALVWQWRRTRRP